MSMRNIVCVECSMQFHCTALLRIIWHECYQRSVVCVECLMQPHYTAVLPFEPCFGLCSISA